MPADNFDGQCFCGGHKFVPGYAEMHSFGGWYGRECPACGWQFWSNVHDHETYTTAWQRASYDKWVEDKSLPFNPISMSKG